MEDYSKDPDFPVYCQDSSMFPETLAQLAHVHYQKKLFLHNKNEFLSEGKAGMVEQEVPLAPISVSPGNSFSFMFTIAFHIFVFLGSTLSMVMLLPQVYTILKQKKLRGLVAAIALYKQATGGEAAPIEPTTEINTKVICHDPWVSFILTLLTIIGMLAYIYKHGRHLALIYGHKFTNMCQVHVLACTKTHYVKIKIAELGANPSLFSMNKSLEINQVSLQRGYIWDYIHINWGEVVLKHAEKVVTVREHMCVPLIDKIRLRKVFMNVTEYNVMVQQGDTWLGIQEEEEGQ